LKQKGGDLVATTHGHPSGTSSRWTRNLIIAAVGVAIVAAIVLLVVFTGGGGGAGGGY
jgi:hypothetical protein